MFIPPSNPPVISSPTAKDKAAFIVRQLASVHSALETAGEVARVCLTPSPAELAASNTFRGAFTPAEIAAAFREIVADAVITLSAKLAAAQAAADAAAVTRIAAAIAAYQADPDIILHSIARYGPVWQLLAMDGTSVGSAPKPPTAEEIAAWSGMTAADAGSPVLSIQQLAAINTLVLAKIGG